MIERVNRPVIEGVQHPVPEMVVVHIPRIQSPHLDEGARAIVDGVPTDLSTRTGTNAGKVHFAVACGHACAVHAHVSHVMDQVAQNLVVFPAHRHCSARRVGHRSLFKNTPAPRQIDAGPRTCAVIPIQRCHPVFVDGPHKTKVAGINDVNPAEDIFGAARVRVDRTRKKTDTLNGDPASARKLEAVQAPFGFDDMTRRGVPPWHPNQETAICHPEPFAGTIQQLCHAVDVVQGARRRPVFVIPAGIRHLHRDLVST